MNSITLSGEITEKGIKVIRESGIADELPIDDFAKDFFKDKIGQKVRLVGQLRTRNIDGHVPLDVYVWTPFFPYDREINLFKGIGRLCKKPILRKTPLTNKDICDALISFDCKNNESSKAYVPCIAWNRNARLLALEEVGARFYITGRLQSRVYKKNDKEYTTHELSIETIERIE